MNLQRLFWPAVAVIVAIAGTLEIRSALGETQVWDEGIHISAGYSYLTFGDFSWNIEHPPLVKMASALPLRFLRLSAEPNDAAGKRKDQVRYGVDFLYKNRLHADTILMAARAPNILLTLLFTIAIAWWTRRRYGDAAGLMAAAMCAFDPNLIAHGRYVTTDFPITVFFFFSCVLWVEYLERDTRRNLLLACAAIALALVTKFSSILLLPPLVILYAVCWIRRRREFSVLRLLRTAGTLLAVTVAVVVIVYWPETLRCFTTTVPRIAAVANRNNAIGELLYRAGNALNLPAHAYLYGLNAVADHNVFGHSSYLLGMRSDKGWWYYFPVVFAVKSTMAALAATLLLLAGGLWLAVKRRSVTPMALGLSIPPVLYFLFSMSSGINIGMRHILPVYPFLYVGAAAFLAQLPARRAASYAMLAFAALQVGECARITPDYLAFFNEIAGGPGRGPEYLVDSNIDWGQDVKKLVHWLDQHGTRRARIYYFGNAQMRYYGVDEVGFPGPMDEPGWAAVDEYCIVNVTPLNGVYVPLSHLAYLRLRQPIAKIGWSMYVYDLRKQSR